MAWKCAPWNPTTISDIRVNLEADSPNPLNANLAAKGKKPEKVGPTLDPSSSSVETEVLVTNQ